MAPHDFLSAQSLLSSSPYRRAEALVSDDRRRTAARLLSSVVSRASAPVPVCTTAGVSVHLGPVVPLPLQRPTDRRLTLPPPRRCPGPSITGAALQVSQTRKELFCNGLHTI